MQASGLVELANGRWFGALAAMLRDQGRINPATREALRLASIGQRVLSLDAEDFFDLAGTGRRPWAEALRRCGFPKDPHDRRRGALASLVPLTELMLEALDVRAARGEPQQVVVVAHLIGEYLPQLACESLLGHAGDPLLLGRHVGERWGSDDPLCGHSSTQRSTARRSVRACDDDEGFLNYLDRFHSRLGATLAVCAMNRETVSAGERPEVGERCARPCQWILAPALEARRDLDARMRLALLYGGSPLVALRHHAPVGHFFAVPSEREIARAWAATWHKLTQQWPDASNPIAGASSSGEGPLPGIELLVSAVAGRPVQPGTVLAGIANDIVQVLGR